MDTVRTRVATFVVCLLLLAGCSREAPVVEPVRAVRTLTVATDTAGGSISYAAEIRARTESRLSFRVPGKLLQRRVELGSRVRAGQVLAQLDSRDLLLGQQGAQASLAAAKASLDQAEADFARSNELRVQGFIGAAELERRQTALKAAQAQAEQARTQLSVQTNQARYADLVADVGGVVTGVDAEPGMVLAAGTPVLRLAHDGPRDVVFSVPEDKVALVRKVAGEPAGLRVDLWGDNNRTWHATLREVSASADPVTRTFLVKADLEPAAANDVRLGQTATVVVDLPRVAGINKLPLSALKEEKGRTVVWIVDPTAMTVSAHAVEVAGIDGNEAVVTSGLQAGQLVVTAGVHVLNPGQKVKLYAEPGAARAPALATAGSQTRP